MTKKFRKERAPSYTLRKTGFTKVGSRELTNWATTGNRTVKVSTTNLVITNFILFGLIIFLVLI